MRATAITLVLGMAVLPTAAQTPQEQGRPHILDKDQDTLSPAEWASLRQLTRNLMTDEGVRRLLAEQPGLMESYADPAGLISLVQKWRAQISELPAQMVLANPERYQVELRRTEERLKILVFFVSARKAQNIPATVVASDWVNGRLMGLRFYRGVTKSTLSGKGVATSGTRR